MRSLSVTRTPLFAGETLQRYADKGTEDKVVTQTSAFPDIVPI